MTSLTSFLGPPVTLPERHPDGTYRVRGGEFWSDPIPPGTTQAEIERMAEMVRSGWIVPSWKRLRAMMRGGAK